MVEASFFPIGVYMLKNQLVSPQRQMALLALSKVGGAAPELVGLCAKFCKIDSLGTGEYEITVNVQRPFSQKVHAVVTPHAVGFASVEVADTDKLKLTVKTFDDQGVADDVDFELLIVGSYAIDLIG